jgi:ubiquinone biosynthesis protein
MPAMNVQTLGNIRRIKDIAVTLVRWGFGGVVAGLGVPSFLSAALRLLPIKRRGADLAVPERIRRVLEDLGPTFVKLGQIASTRADLLPPEWIGELKKLQDMVPPFPFEDARAVVERSLGAPIGERFASFDVVPVASASIAQVHFAELRDGSKAAVKVKRPGIDRMIESDISIMMTMARLLESHVPASRRYRPVEVVEEFARVIKNEQDLSIEGVNVNRFHNMFKGDPGVQIPRVYWDYTSRDVLTMERVSGTPIDEIERIKALGLDVKAIAARGIELFFRQVFEFGVFHADLHPGNIFVRDDGAIIYLDFGIVGRIDRDLRKYLASMLFYLIRQDYYRMAAVHREMGLISAGIDLHEFEEALRDITEPIFGRTLEQINVSALLMKLIQTARRFNMTLQPNLLLLQKSMVIIEGVGRQLYPDINMWEVARPLVYRWMIKEKFSPASVVGKAADRAGDVLTSALDIPVLMSSALKKAVDEELRIGFVHRGLDELPGALDGAGRRIGGAIVIGAVVISATLAAIFHDGAGPSGVPVASVAGFVLAILLWLWFFGRDGSRRARTPDRRG